MPAEQELRQTTRYFPAASAATATSSRNQILPAWAGSGFKLADWLPAPPIRSLNYIQNVDHLDDPGIAELPKAMQILVDGYDISGARLQSAFENPIVVLILNDVGGNCEVDSLLGCQDQKLKVECHETEKPRCRCSSLR